MKRLTLVMMLVLIGAMPVDAYVVKEDTIVVEKSNHLDATQLPSIVILYDSEMKRKIEVESIKEIMTITEGIKGASSVKGEWAKGEKLGTLDFGNEELIDVYYGKDRENVYLLGNAETMSMSRKDFFSLFYPSIHTRPLPPGEGGDVQPLPPGQTVQPDDFLPL